MMMNIFETIMAGCAAVVTICITTFAVVLTATFIRSLIEND